jgi:hypothetical protein
MVLRTLGPGLLARLIGGDDPPDTAWMLFGPTDAEVVEADNAPPDDLLLAAE